MWVDWVIYGGGVYAAAHPISLEALVLQSSAASAVHAFKGIYRRGSQRIAEGTAEEGHASYPRIP
jgi:hypothetical protein